jgi:peptidyl-prolyl cis-trans isomerase C
VQSVRSQFTSEQKFLARLASEGFTVDSYRVHMRRVLSANEYAKSFASGIEVSDAEVHDFYIANQEKFRVPEGARARHILLKMSAHADEETQAATYDAAGKLLERINAGEDFAAIAIAESQDSSAAQGGDLGYFPRGQMVKSFDDAVFALQAGEVSGIVRTPFGLHIIKVEDREDAQTVPEELAKERIVQYLGQVKGDQLIKDEVAALREAASIELLAAQ